MKCPRCIGGSMLFNYGEVFCINCGHRLDIASQVSISEQERQLQHEKFIKEAMNGYHIIPFDRRVKAGLRWLEK